MPRAPATSLALALALLPPLAGCGSGLRTATPPKGAPITAVTPAGSLRGIDAKELLVFLGVPYAAPPVGEGRFRPPRPLPRATAPIDATRFGPACPQLVGGAGRGPAAPDAKVEGREDCLTLNVWTHGDQRRRPVMVFIHGGAFVQGSNGKRFYDAGNFARLADVVVVTINYRLGALGFLAHEALAKESSDGSAGNYGLRDQIAALAWVRDNIRDLGGDPSSVTVFGESAGAASVCALLASPLAKGLFARAIVESGGGCQDLPTLRDPDAAGNPSGFARGAAIAAAAGCDRAPDAAACLRAAEPAVLVRAASRAPRGATPFALPVSPVIDGVVLKATAFDRLRRGEVSVPLIVGSNADEASLFLLAFGLKPETAVDYERIVRAAWGRHADAVLRVYPATGPAAGPAANPGGPAAALARAVTEVAFVCPALALVEAAASGPKPVYAYYFAHHPRGFIGRRLGAFHGIELAYLFWNVPASSVPTHQDQEVAGIMRAAWASFARSGEPGGSPHWPPFTLQSPNIYRIEAEPRVVTDVTDGRCRQLRAAGVIRSP